jgi:Spy/CpxP family protein refolding chaperone
MKNILLAIGILTLGFSAASAQYGPRHDNRGGYQNEYRRERPSEINHLQREARQQIATGIQRGRLSSREANALMNQYERIEAKERKYSRHGRLSPRETRILRDDLHRLMADTRRLSERRGDNWARGRRH